jgi:D-3-phosphoglycerate dehydrogenase / 2-oxoglutarate reductase
MCLLVQPIDPQGVERLLAAGIEPVLASAPTMAAVEREIADAVAVITRNAGLNRRAIDAAAHLRVIGNHGVGLDPVDVPHATALGIPVVNTPGANAVSVAELTVALALAVVKRIRAAEQATRRGDFAFKYSAGISELAGATVGIVGFGQVGRRAAAMFVHGFGMRLLVHAPSPDAAEVATLGGRQVDLPELLAESDLISLHLPLSPARHHMLDAAAIARMKPGAILINTARGALVDESALAEALSVGRLAGAGLDVFAQEPIPLGHPLLGLPNVVVTPHMGGSSRQAGIRTALSVVEQVLEVLAGRRPAHLVNPAAWPRRRG